jgi:hypothetical protein
MAQSAGGADQPLHGGRVPIWLENSPLRKEAPTYVSTKSSVLSGGAR